MFFSRQVTQGLLGVPAAAGGATDPNFSDVKLLLHGEGTNGGTTFTDSSSNGYTYTYRDALTTSTSQYKFGSSSIRAPGTDGKHNYLVFSGTAGDFVANGKWTLEAWIRLDSTSNYPHLFQIGSGSGRNVIYVNGGKIRLYADGVGDALIQCTTTLPTNTWFHLAIVNNYSGGNSVKIYYNGTQEGGTHTGSLSDASTNTLAIANPYYPADNGNSVTGYYDEVRFTKGVARYTANFSVPTEAFPDS